MNGLKKMLSAEAIKDLFNHYGFRRYLANTGWLFLGRMFGLLASFFVNAYIARYLQPTNYGLLNYVISFAGLFAFLSTLGIDSIVMRDIIKHPEKTNEYLGTGFFIKLLGSLFAVSLVTVLSFLINKDFFTSLLMLIISSTFIFQAFNIIDLYFQSKVLSKNTVKVQIFSTIFVAMMRVVFIQLHLNVFWFLLTYLIESIIISLGLITAYLRIGSMRSWSLNRSLIIQILNDSWPLMLASAAVAIYFRIDQVMIKYLLGNEPVGVYSAAVKISEIWYFIPYLIVSSLFPAIVNAKATDQKIYERRLARLYSFLFWLAVLVGVFVSIFANLLILKIFGSKYLGAALSLKIYVWSGVSVFWGMIMGQYLIAENYTRISFAVTFLAMVGNIILNLYFIPKYGISGAAIATLLSYSISNISIFIFPKTRSHGYLMLKSIFTNPLG